MNNKVTKKYLKEFNKLEIKCEKVFEQLKEFIDNLEYDLKNDDSGYNSSLHQYAEGLLSIMNGFNAIVDQVKHDLYLEKFKEDEK